jgi:hypothetical protein
MMLCYSIRASTWTLPHIACWLRLTGRHRCALVFFFDVKVVAILVVEAIILVLLVLFYGLGSFGLLLGARLLCLPNA